MRYLLATFIAIGVIGAVLLLRVPVPDFAEVRERYRSSDLVVRARDGSPIQELRRSNEVRRFEWVPLQAIPEAIREAVIRAEDRRFRDHAGVDWRAIGGALLSGGGRGASTITMQLGGMILPELRPLPGSSRSYRQKFEQIRVARSLEDWWSKDELLEAYLNLVPFRGEIEGISGAARLLLGKEIESVSPDEGVMLAVVVRSPNAPPAVLAERGCRLKELLRRDSTISFPTETCDRTDEIAQLIGSGGVPAARLQRINIAPHIGRLISQQDQEVRDFTSTIDAALQRFAIEQLRAQLATLRDANVADGAVLVVRNDTGEVEAYVGNSGQGSSARFVDGVKSRRQAGSTLKPFLYALALERRLLTAGTLLNDAPLDLPVGAGVYRPKNYDNIYRGPVSVRVALAASLNVPAVLTVERVGVTKFVEFLGRLGFGALQPADLYGPSVALGSPTVSLWELVRAYRALARGGIVSDLVVGAGEERTPAHPVLSTAVAAIIGDILADRASRSPTFGLENALATPYWSAVKTGTSKDMTDNWCIGFTRDYTIGVWVGNFSGEPMHNVSGVTGAAPLWTRIGEYLAKRPDFNAAPPAIPSEIVIQRGAGVKELYLSGTEPVGSIVPVSAQERPITITAPIDGMVVAFDPDIPPDVQKIPFEASGRVPGGRWVLNGDVIASAQSAPLWTPRPGRYTLALQRADGHPLAVVQFLVKGGGEKGDPLNGK